MKEQSLGRVGDRTGKEFETDNRERSEKRGGLTVSPGQVSPWLKKIQVKYCPLVKGLGKIKYRYPVFQWMLGTAEE